MVGAAGLSSFASPEEKNMNYVDIMMIINNNCLTFLLLSLSLHNQNPWMKLKIEGLKLNCYADAYFNLSN